MAPGWHAQLYHFRSEVGTGVEIVHSHNDDFCLQLPEFMFMLSYFNLSIPLRFKKKIALINFAQENNKQRILGVEVK